MSRRVRNVIVVVSLAVIALSGSVIRRSKSVAWPQVAIPASIDLGVVCPGERLTGAFAITNLGRKNLRTRPVTTCRCLPLEIARTHLRAGESTTVSFSLEAPTEWGPFSQDVGLYCTDGKREALLKTKVTGRVEQGVRAVPGSVDFDRLAWGATLRRKVTLSSFDQELEILSAVASSPCVTVSKSCTPETQASLDICVAHPFRKGQFRDAVLVHTSDRRQPFKLVPLSGEFAGALQAIPATLVFDQIPDGLASVPQLVEVRVPGPGQITVNTRHPSLLEAKKLELSESRRRRVRVVLHPENLRESTTSGITISFRDRHGRSDDLEIPVYIFSPKHRSRTNGATRGETRARPAH